MWAILLNSLSAGDGNRLAYLDERSPFYVHPGFPRLTTPQWFGEPDVDAVVIVSIDDMTDNTEKYRDVLAPILKRLKEIEGRSPLSIFTCRVKRDDPQLAPWLADGVRLDVHTRTHPCPLLGRPLIESTAEVQACLDNLFEVPLDAPAVFRMPCCDSINSASPRFFSEILPRKTPGGHFFLGDSSVLMFVDDSYRAYAPFKNFTANATGYPFPFVVAKSIWEFPILAPSDSQGQNLQQANNPKTVADIETAIDKTVALRGLYTLCFHPHGWIRSSQVIEILDHVVNRYGRRVRFLNFHDAIERLTLNLLGGVPLRSAEGNDNGVRVLDLNADGFLDVIIGNDDRRECRVWEPESMKWRVTSFPFQIVTRTAEGVRETGVKLGVLRLNGFASALEASETGRRLAHFDGEAWRIAPQSALAGLQESGHPILTRERGRDRGVRLRDVDADGLCEILVSNPDQNAVFHWDDARSELTRLPFALPGGPSLAGADGEDRGLLFADLDLDGRDDVILSNEDEFHVYLFESLARGWSRRVLHGPAGSVGALPKISDHGSDRGAWIKDRVLYCANEETARLPELTELRDFSFMIRHRESSPLEPVEALKRFRLPDGFQIELFASEPLVEDPVAIDFGLDGRVWVVEMGTYPLGPGAGGKVKLLLDRDGDGRADAAKVFADGFSFPTGVLAHGKGVLVTCAPDILYLEDVDGDDRADLRRVVFTGFGEGNQQHRVNGLHYGLDNWIHGANGESGGEISSLTRPGALAVPLGGRDFRFTPDLVRFEPESGHTQFGLAMDDLGNRFGASNSRHLMHAVLADRYLARNPHWAPPDPVIDVPDHGAMARIFPISEELLSLNDIHVPGHFSSACGVAIYRGDLFPAPYRGCAYVCEPVANIVHRDVLTPDGATFRAERGEPTSEFIASSDNWFRPVYCATGPDGALYVVDMYRWVIEHPAYIPREIQQILDFTAGRDRGRIYRVTHGTSSASPTARRHDLRSETTPSLIAMLCHANGWRRDAAQRLLVERGDLAAVPELESLASTSTEARIRAHALWTLDGLKALSVPAIVRALRSEMPDVREQALRLAEPRLDAEPEILSAALSLADDPSLRVRLQAALTLGSSGRIEAGEALSRIFRRDWKDPWMRAALLSSSLQHAGRLLAWLFADPNQSQIEEAAWREIFEALVQTVTRKGDTAQIEDLLAKARRPEDVSRWQILLLAGLVDSSPTGDVEGFDTVRSQARSIALRPDAPLEERVEAIRAIGCGPAGSGLGGELGQALLDLKSPGELQRACAHALSRSAASGDKTSADTLLAAWPQAGPILRGEILSGLLATPKAASRLLEAVEAGRIQTREVDAAARKRLADLGDKEVRERALRLLPPETSGDREEVVRRTLEALKGLERSAARGREVFLKTCAQCHRLEGEGFEVGPDLSGARSKGEPTLVEAILNPSRMVPPRYTQYAVETDRGVAAGIIAKETGPAITLLRAGGVAETILRADIRSLGASPDSLMPSDLERVLPPSAIADLLEFLAAQPRLLGSVTEAEAKQARAETIATAHNGLERVLKSQGQGPQASWLGQVSMPYVRQLDGTGELVWTTAPVPAPIDAGGRFTFRWPAALGYVSQPPGRFTLYLGDRRLLDFDVTLESHTWRSEGDGASLTFAVHARNAEDATGVMTLDLPAAWLEPGKPATLRVTGSASNSRRWLGLLPVK